MTGAPLLDRDEMLALAEFVGRRLRADQSLSHTVSKGFASVEITDEPDVAVLTAPQP